MEISGVHIVVGVDIGYTYTGVAIGSTMTSDHVNGIKLQNIQDWPDTRIKEKNNKVPTRLTYQGGDHRVRSWGFGCPRESQRDDGEIVRAMFKFMLDENCLKETNEANEELYKQRAAKEAPTNKRKPKAFMKETMTNVHAWWVDYLKQIYICIKEYLRSKSYDMGSSTIEYIFSLPTAWNDNQQLIDQYERLITQAGFGLGEHSSARIGLTEAIASAVYTATRVDHKFQVDDVVIVCDAGGGTTDFCLVKVKNIDNRTVELETLDSPISIHTGSVDIDNEFKAAFTIELDRLKKDEKLNFIPSKFAADEATQDRSQSGFQIIKEKWGKSSRTLLNSITFKISDDLESREEGEQIPEDMVEDSKDKISFPRSKIDSMFDRQITKILEILDATLNNTPQKVSSLILTGGLGSSPYLQAKLIDYFKPRGMRILVDKDRKEPPLSVCKGLVYDRIQRLVCGTSVMRTRRCRASYGILYNKPYKKSEHTGRETLKDKVNGKKYVRDEIFWFVKKGDEIKEDEPIRFQRVRQTCPENSEDAWEDIFVGCRILPTDLLPQHFDREKKYVEEVATIVSTSIPDSLISKRTFPLVGKKFLQGYYEIQAAVDEDDLKVQTSVKGNLTGECRFVKVPWEFSESNEEHSI